MGETSPQALDWQTGIPLFTRYMLWTLAKAMFATWLIGAGLVSFLLAMQGEWEGIPPIFLILGAVVCGLFLLSLMIMAVVFRNRIETRFIINETGVEMINADKTASTANRAAVVIGGLAGSPGTAGSGLIAASQEHQSLRWDGSFRAVFERATHTISFRNNWRTLMRVYCLPENYAAAAALVERNMARAGTAVRKSSHAPLSRYLVRTLLVIIAVVPVMGVCDMFDVDLFMPFLVLCFALATVWTVPLLSLVVLGGLAVIAVQILLAASEERQSFFSNAVYRRYELVDGDEWVLIGLAAAGALYLGLLAWRTLRGHTVPMLLADWQDAGED